MGQFDEEPAEPVAWINEGKRRVFYTSLGHRDDFANPDFRRLLVNATLWAVGQLGPPQTNALRAGTHGLTPAATPDDIAGNKTVLDYVRGFKGRGQTVEAGEEEIKALGFRQFRVRFHGELVRIEIAREEMQKALTMEMAGQLTAIFKPLGFHYVTLDLEGYRQGSMNETLNLKRT